jgi:hypothetical protein
MMLTAIAFVVTPRPQRYIKQLVSQLTDLQLAAYCVQMTPHLLTCRLSITAAQYRQQSPVPCNCGPS